jgi:hypothetical protein
LPPACKLHLYIAQSGKKQCLKKVENPCSDPKLITKNCFHSKFFQELKIFWNDILTPTEKVK